MILDYVMGLIVAFTFQSGSILISSLNIKIPRSIFLYIPIWFYSNPTESLKLCHLLFFTFQSGSILICPAKAVRLIATVLYIPIWFYSNVICPGFLPPTQDFTFQSGSILMSIKVTLPQRVKPLHSNLVLF